LDALKEMTQDPQVEERILFEEDLTPVQLKERFHLRDGAAFGIGHSLTQSIMLRPQAKSPHLDRLYFVGASTHPGNGVTMVMKSAQIAADLIAKEHPITKQGVKPL
jgi:phytoene desaturase